MFIENKELKQFYEVLSSSENFDIIIAKCFREMKCQRQKFLESIENDK